MKMTITIQLEGVPPSGTVVQKPAPLFWCWERDMRNWARFRNVAVSFASPEFADILEEALDEFEQLTDPKPKNKKPKKKRTGEGSNGTPKARRADKKQSAGGTDTAG